MWETARCQLSSNLITSQKKTISHQSSPAPYIRSVRREFKTHLWLLFLGFWGFLSKFWMNWDRVVPLTVPHCSSVPKAWNDWYLYHSLTLNRCLPWQSKLLLDTNVYQWRKPDILKLIWGPKWERQPTTRKCSFSSPLIKSFIRL